MQVLSNKAALCRTQLHKCVAVEEGRRDAWSATAKAHAVLVRFCALNSRSRGALPPWRSRRAAPALCGRPWRTPTPCWRAPAGRLEVVQQQHRRRGDRVEQRRCFLAGRGERPRRVGEVLRLEGVQATHKRGDEPLMHSMSAFCVRRTLSAHLSLAACRCRIVLSALSTNFLRPLG